jgi:hypothetical protein
MRLVAGGDQDLGKPVQTLMRGTNHFLRATPEIFLTLIREPPMPARRYELAQWLQ